MSWEFPSSLFRTGTVLDWLDVNGQLALYASQIDGGLNEHNFEAAVGADLYTAQKLSENVAIRAFQTATARDPATPSGLLLVPPTEQWTNCGGEIDFGSPGGKAVVMISFQTYGNAFSTPEGPGLQFAIELDGAPQMSTLLGSGDMSNDRMNTDESTSSQIPLNSGVSFRALYEAHAIQGLFTVDAGKHTVRLLARFPYTTNTNVPDHRIGSVETIVLVLRA